MRRMTGKEINGKRKTQAFVFPIQRNTKATPQRAFPSPLKLWCGFTQPVNKPVRAQGVNKYLEWIPDGSREAKIWILRVRKVEAKLCGRLASLSLIFQIENTWHEADIWSPPRPTLASTSLQGLTQAEGHSGPSCYPCRDKDLRENLGLSAWLDSSSAKLTSHDGIGSRSVSSQNWPGNRRAALGHFATMPWCIWDPAILSLQPVHSKNKDTFPLTFFFKKKHKAALFSCKCAWGVGTLWALLCPWLQFTVPFSCQWNSLPLILSIYQSWGCGEARCKNISTPWRIFFFKSMGRWSCPKNGASWGGKTEANCLCEGIPSVSYMRVCINKEK